jgi:hypothetical protein
MISGKGNERLSLSADRWHSYLRDDGLEHRIVSFGMFLRLSTQPNSNSRRHIGPPILGTGSENARQTFATWSGTPGCGLVLLWRPCLVETRNNQKARHCVLLRLLVRFINFQPVDGSCVQE